MLIYQFTYYLHSVKTKLKSAHFIPNRIIGNKKKTKIPFHHEMQNDFFLYVDDLALVNKCFQNNSKQI